MITAVPPVNNYGYYANVIASGNTASIPVTTYDQLLALQAIDDEEQLQTSGSQIAGSTNDTTNLSVLNSSDLLNLSPAALNILNGIENSAQAVNTQASVNVPDITLNTTIAGTITQNSLTTQQQAQVATIVSQYANQPVTQQTFTNIENALTAVGINPLTVSLQQLLNPYEYAYEPGLAFNEQVFTDTLASELTDA